MGGERVRILACEKLPEERVAVLTVPAPNPRSVPNPCWGLTWASWGALRPLDPLTAAECLGEANGQMAGNSQICGCKQQSVV